jgi:hypothetical protein
MGRLDFFAIQDELEELLGSRVDLVTRRSVERSDNPLRRQSILESATEIYADWGIFVDFIDQVTTPTVRCRSF